MLNLSSALNAPPIVFPQIQVPKIGMPPGTPGNAPVMPISQQAAAAMSGMGGCAGCSQGAVAGVGDLLPPPSWWGRIPLWVKISGGLAVAGGLTFLVWRAGR